MQTSCLGCGCFTDPGPRCDQCEAPRKQARERRRAQQPNRKGRIYNTAAWKQARLTAIRMANNQCQGCGTTNDLTVHHRIAIAQGGGSDQDNLLVLCRVCHGKVDGSKASRTQG